MRSQVHRLNDREVIGYISGHKGRLYTKENTMPSAHARHILVDSEEKCEELKSKIESGADFAVLAREHSQCPSGRRGGDLGEFNQGQMVKEFDDIVFQKELGITHGPVKTQFGYHLIEILSRND
ncbi:MAG: peptidylprolyl isomerase [Candidatus Latescibacterota bacterium]|nr:MAG: peptidylprolyl isomerase [Candidatus Latescibacterota bacterium]